MDYQDIIKQFFVFFGISDEAIHISQDGEMINVTLDVPETESGRFIGRYASTLDSLQLILSLMLNNSREDHLHVSVDVGGYRAERLEVLRSMAERISTTVSETGTPHAFPPLSSTDRRAVHLLFQDHATLYTYSEGVGQSRRLILAPKS